jgi:hypothetical protein
LRFRSINPKRIPSGIFLQLSVFASSIIPGPYSASEAPGESAPVSQPSASATNFTLSDGDSSHHIQSNRFQFQRIPAKEAPGGLLGSNPQAAHPPYKPSFIDSFAERFPLIVRLKLQDLVYYLLISAAVFIAETCYDFPTYGT